MVRKHYHNKLVVTLSIRKESVKVLRDGEEVASADFCFNKTQIRVTDVATVDKYQNCGYGKLLFCALKNLAQQKKLPLLLWSLESAIPFYEAIGMEHLDDPKVQKKIKFGNVSKKELKEKVNNDDFVWIPKRLRRRPTIYL
jgi:N-acetylglutamate synthase-like GNAT family acetyltransferase